MLAFLDRAYPGASMSWHPVFTEDPGAQRHLVQRCDRAYSSDVPPCRPEHLRTDVTIREPILNNRKMGF